VALEGPSPLLSPPLQRQSAVEKALTIRVLLSPGAHHPPPSVPAKLVKAVQLALASLRVRRVHLENEDDFEFSVLLMGHLQEQEHEQEQPEAPSGHHQSGHLVQLWDHHVGVVQAAVALARHPYPGPGKCLALVVEGPWLPLDPQLLL